MTVTFTQRPRGSVDAAVATLAERQFGTISRAQAIELGISKTAIHRRLSSGRWLRAFPGVYLIAGTRRSWIVDVWCAYLAAGPSAVVTHDTALRLHGIDRVPLRPITLTAPHSSHMHLDGVFVHQIDDLAQHRVTTRSGLAASTPERAIVELAATAGERFLGDVLDDAIAAKHVHLARVAACLREVARPGKPGVGKLARVLDARADGEPMPQSELERALLTALAAGGLPPPKKQFPLPGRGAIDGLVDAAYPDARLILEADGRRWHTRVRDLKRDHERDTEAARAGWLTLRFVYEQIVHHPGEVCAAIRDVRAVRLSRPEEIGSAQHVSRK